MNKQILTDEETMEMLTAFYVEALQFLGVSEAEWAEVKTGVVMGQDGKAEVCPYVDYPNGKIIVCVPVIRIMLQMNPVITNDSPSVYRTHGYKLARMWHQYLKDGVQRDFMTDKDSWDFAMALSILKGINYADKDLNFAFNMLRNEFGIDCCVKEAFDLSSQRKRKFVTMTDTDCHRREEAIVKLWDESSKLPLARIAEGELGSKTNPFSNVDEAAAYILKIEQERLASDPYRQTIDHEQYYFDLEHRCFRIPWASANVSYYPIHGSKHPCFVVNQLSQREGRNVEIPRFSIKPSLANNKFLFRGQSQFYDPCVPSLFRNKGNVAARQFVDDIIQMNELEVLLRQHPLVRLFEDGFYLLHDFFRFRVDYEGLSQHYYNNTPKLDLTSDMDVAKFFAVTWFNMAEDRYEKYMGSELGVLYYYDLTPDAFTLRAGRNYYVETIGKQPFMRSGNQSGFLTQLAVGENFNDCPEVRYVFFRHDAAVTDRIFAEAQNGDKYMPQEMLRTHWYRRMSDTKAIKEISLEALQLNYAHNPGVSHSSIRKVLEKKGFHISSKNKQIFTPEELDDYYAGILDFWKDFCSNVYFYSPEGNLMRKHLMNLPDDPRYKWAFYKS